MKILLDFSLFSFIRDGRSCGQRDCESDFVPRTDNWHEVDSGGWEANSLLDYYRFRTNLI